MSGPCLCGDPACSRCFPKIPPDHIPLSGGRSVWKDPDKPLSPTIEQMKMELVAAGWKPLKATRWQAPWGSQYLGPYQAWRYMKNGGTIFSDKDTDWDEGHGDIEGE